MSTSAVVKDTNSSSEFFAWALSEPHSAKPASMRASREEVLVKLIRLLANLAMHPDIGPDIAHQPEVASSLLRLLQQHDLSEDEELVLNCAALATNLSFYDNSTNKILWGPSLARDGQFAIDLLQCITPLLLCNNEESIVEAARVYGNFSRLPEVRSTLFVPAPMSLNEATDFKIFVIPGLIM
eukprot:scaffold410866_cov23-Prasinocladus_malaysianus.AAC.2